MSTQVCALATWDEFCDSIRDDTFFDQLDALRFDHAADKEQLRAALGWFPLLRTDRIYDWARHNDWFSGPGFHDPITYPISQLLLRRFILNLETRRDPERLESYWGWITDCYGGGSRMRDVWTNAELAGTLGDASSISHQEAHFAKEIAHAAQTLSLASGPSWAHEGLARVADARGAGDTTASKAFARVVFAWKNVPPNSLLRPGLVVDFELLGESGHPSINARGVFGEEFLHSVDTIVAGRLPRYRNMEHRWAHLGSQTLDRTSGSMAILTSQHLAAGGSDRRQPLAIPPWVVITATLDPHGHTSGGNAAAVDSLPEKLQVLAEDGVRVVVVGGDIQRNVSPAHEDQKLVNVDCGFEQLGDRLIKSDWTWPTNMTTPGSLVPRAESVQRSRWDSEFNFPREEFVPPDYLFAEILSGVDELPGRGYVHLQTPRGVGKSIAAESLFNPEFDVSHPLLDRFDVVVGYRILQGYPENPRLLVDSIFRQLRAKYDGQLAIEQPSFDKTLEETRHAIVHGLQRAATSLGRILVVIDGIDELTTDIHAAASADPNQPVPATLELLPRANELPAGVVCLILSRQNVRESTITGIDAIANDAALIARRTFAVDTPSYAVALRDALISSLGPGIRPWIDKILMLSERRFVSVRFYIELLRGQRLGDLADLPTLDQLLPDSLARLESRVGREPYEQWYRPTLLLVAAAQEPITRRHLLCWLGLQDSADDRERINEVLRDLRLLVTERRVAHLDCDALIVPANQAIADWIAESPETSQLLSAAHRQIADADYPAIEDAFLPEHDDLAWYQLQHTPTHHLLAGDQDGAIKFFFGDDIDVRFYHVVNNNLGARLRSLQARQAWDLRLVQITSLITSLGGVESAVEHNKALVNELAGVYNNRGLTLRQQTDLAASLASYARAIELYEQVITSLGGVESAVEHNKALVNELARVYNNRGLTLRQQTDLAASLASYARAIELRELLITSLGGVESAVEHNKALVNELARVYNNRGNTYQQQTDLAASLASYARAIELYEQVITSLGGVESAVEHNKALVNELARVYNNRGNTYQQQTDLAASLASYARAIELYEQVITSLGGVESAVEHNKALVNELARVYNNRGLTLRQQTDLAASLASYARAIELYEQVITSLGGVESAVEHNKALVNELAGVYNNRGLTLRQQTDLAASLASYARAIELYEQVITSLGGVESAVEHNKALVNELAGVYNNRGNTYQQQTDLAASLASYARAIELYEQVITSLGGVESAVEHNKALVNELAGVYNNRGLTLRQQTDLAASLASYARAIELYEQVITSLGGVESAVEHNKALVADLIAAIGNSATTVASKNSPREAADVWARAYQHAQQLLPAGPFAVEWVLWTSYQQSRQRELDGDREAALECIHRCLQDLSALRERIGPQIADPRAKSDFQKFMAVVQSEWVVGVTDADHQLLSEIAQAYKLDE